MMLGCQMEVDLGHVLSTDERLKKSCAEMQLHELGGIMMDMDQMCSQQLTIRLCIQGIVD